MLENTAITRIKKLSPLLINQLAAGEVVTRPAAVVKELLENAIDAKATHIEVHITQGGMGMIQVVDNGVGIHPDDMVMAITRHATSKVADVAKLQGISTLGFRGEALAATAAVSRLTLTSSHDDSGIGRQLQVSGILAQEPQLMPMVHNRGTTVTIKDLYFNVPARRGNLKSIATEFTHIETFVREVALARADVTLTLFHDNKKRLTLSASSNDNANTASVNNNSHLPISRLEQALGLELADNALEVSVDLSSLLHHSVDSTVQLDNLQPGISPQTNAQQALISGWLWPTAQSQPNLPKLLYVNGRLIKEPIISSLLRQLATSTEIGAMSYALHFELPMQWLNVNVHPSKQRIKISPLNNIMAHLSHAITRKLKSVVIERSSLVSPSAKSLDGDIISDNMADSIADNVGHHFSASKLQVQSAKHPYQSAATESIYLSEKHTFKDKTLKKYSITKNPFEDSLSVDSNLIHESNDQANISSMNKAQLSPLPYCLDVITELSGCTDLAADYMALSSVANDDHITSLPPWLLFYSQGRLVVITEADWQKGLASLFASNDYRQLKELANDLTRSQQINQQINRYATQMSTPDLQAFTTDIIEILTTRAITQIESKHLVGLLLSPHSA